MLPEFQTDRLILRELTCDDAGELHHYQSRPEHWVQMAIETEEFTDQNFRVEKYLELRGVGPQRFIFAYVARLKGDGTLIGQVSLSRFNHPGLASVGFGVDSCHSGEGYGTEMVRRILRYGFEDVGVHRISAEIAVENAASRRVAEQAMMQFEGIARGCIFARNRWWDEAQYAALTSDREVRSR
jgi:ribosomal-protein-alanine N-acetyltransferase